jgi:hypothetical protein
MLDPATTTALAGSFYSIAQSCLLTALTEWKKEKDKRGDSERASILQEIQKSKTIERKLEENITAAFRDCRLDSREAEILLRIEQDALLKSEVTRQIRSNAYSSSTLADVLLAAAPELVPCKATISELSRRLVDAIRLAIASDAQLKSVLDLEFQSEASATLETIKRATSATQEQVSSALPAIERGQTEVMHALERIGTAVESFAPAFLTTDTVSMKLTKPMMF